MRYILGIDLGGTNIKVGISDCNFKLHKFFAVSAQEFATPGKGISYVKKLMQEFGRYKFSALGFGFPGLVNYQKGFINYLVNIKGWRNVAWAKLLKRELGIPVFLDNDVNVAALAEYYLGRGKGSRNMLMITLGTGVGGGLILDGKIYRGSSFSAGEIGHFPLGLTGPECNCGGIACLESYIGNRKLISEINSPSFYSRSELLAEIHKKKGILSLEDITFAGRKADSVAIQFWEQVAFKLGQVIVGVVNLLDLDRVIIGGGVAKSGKLLLQPLRKFVKNRAMKIQAKNVKIFNAGLGNKAGVQGASILAYFGLKNKRI